MAVRHGQLASSTAANANWTFTTLVSTKSAQLRPVFLISVVSYLRGLFHNRMTRALRMGKNNSNNFGIETRLAISTNALKKHSRFPSLPSSSIRVHCIYRSLRFASTHTLPIIAAALTRVYTHTHTELPF